jgi:hypothetical protein
MATPYYAAALLPHTLEWTPWNYEWTVPEPNYGGEVVWWTAGVDTPFAGGAVIGQPAVINDAVFIGRTPQYSDDNGQTWDAVGTTMPESAEYWANDAAGNLYFASTSVGGVRIYQVLDPFAGSYTLLGAIDLPGEDLGDTDVYMDENTRWHVAWMSGSGPDRVLYHTYTDNFGDDVVTKALVVSGELADYVRNLEHVTITGKGEHVFVVTQTCEEEPWQWFHPPTLFDPDGWWETEHTYRGAITLYASHDRGSTWTPHHIDSTYLDTYAVDEEGGQGTLLRNASMRFPLCVGEYGLILLYEYGKHTAENKDYVMVDGVYWEDYATMGGLHKPTGGTKEIDVTGEPGVAGFTHSTRTWSGPDQPIWDGDPHDCWRAGDDLLALFLMPFSEDVVDHHMLMLHARIVKQPQTGVITDFYIVPDFACWTRLQDAVFHRVPHFADWGLGGYSFWW